MKPSNPATTFVTGSDEESFTYTPGADPYYIIAHGRSYIPLSVLVFADSAEHAKQILRDMIEAMQVCCNKYSAYKKRIDDEDKHDLAGLHQNRLNTLRKALAEDGYELYIGKADRGQLYKIGWASNDNII